MKIFILGAVFGTISEEQNKFDIYAKTLKEIYPNAVIVSPNTIWKYRENFIKKHPKANLREIDKAMVDFDLQQLCAADLCVCDLSIPSTGMGIELGTLKQQMLKNIIFLAKRNSKISNMVLGAYPENKIYQYDTYNDIITILKKQFKKI